MGWMPRWGSLWMVTPSDSALNFVSVTPSMGILFPLLRRISIHTLVFILLELHVFCELYLGYSELLGFWANIHLSVSVYHVCSFVIGLPHTE